MHVTKAEYVLIDKQPFLRLLIDDKVALIGDIKYSILQEGFVFLLSPDRSVKWDEILPKQDLIDAHTGQKIHLTGCTNDPQILKLTHQFWKAINHLDGAKFQEGPISL